MSYLIIFIPILFPLLTFLFIGYVFYRTLKSKKYRNFLDDQLKVENIMRKQGVTDEKSIDEMKIYLKKSKYDFSFSRVFSDSSMWVLLISNLASIFYVYYNDVPTAYVLLIYWIQSFIIGVVNVIRILMLRGFTTEGFTMGGNSNAPINESTKSKTAAFFSLHYGFFHLIYLFFILAIANALNTNWDWKALLFGAVVFSFSHGWSFIRNKEKEVANKNIGSVMFGPYLRIIPFHLTLILSGALFFFTGPIIFMLLKTVVDVGSHIFKHAKVLTIGGKDSSFKITSNFST